MIDFASLVGKITGKLPGQTDGKVVATGETGVATGGAFADLVRHATLVEASRGPGNLRLVVNNGAMPEVTSAALGGLSFSADGGPASIADESAPVSAEEDEAARVAPDMLVAPPQNPVAASLGGVAPQPVNIVPETITAAPVAASPVAAVPVATTSFAPVAIAQGATLPGVTPSTPITAVTGATSPLASVPAATPPAATIATPSNPTTSSTSATAASPIPVMTNGADPSAAPPAPTGQATGGPAQTVLPAPIAANPVGKVTTPPEEVLEPTAPVVAQPVLPTPIAAHPVGKVTTPPEEALRQAAIASSRPTPVESPGTDADQTVGEMTRQVKPGVLTTALRMLAPRPRASTSEGIDAASANVATPAAASRDVKSVEALSALSLGASEKLQATTASTSSAADTTQALSAPLRSIVEALPPVIQSELGVSSVRAAAGPSTGEVLGDQVIDMGVSGQWIDRMAREIAGLADGTGHSRFTLNPPHLGRLQIDLWREEGATSIRMLTETDEAAQRLQEGRTALQGDARVAALSFASITVEKASGTFDTAPRDQGGQRQGGDLSGQMQQQQHQAEGQGQSRANNARANGSDWVSRIAGDEPNQQDDDSSRAPSRAANGRVRFA